nr:uncharacterized protein LOC104900936 [Ipomoea batatas]
MNVGNISTSPLSSVFGSPPPSPKGIPRTEMMVPRHTLERGETSGGNHDDSSSEEGEGYGMEYANRGLMLQVEDLFRFRHFRAKEIIEWCYVDTHTLETLGIRREYERIATQPFWRAICSWRDATYTPIVREFVATLEVNEEIRDRRFPSIKFKLFNKEYDISSDALGNLLGSGKELPEPILKKSTNPKSPIEEEIVEEILEEDKGQEKEEPSPPLSSKATQAQDKGKEKVDLPIKMGNDTYLKLLCDDNDNDLESFVFDENVLSSENDNHVHDALHDVLDDDDVNDNDGLCDLNDVDPRDVREPDLGSSFLLPSGFFQYNRSGFFNTTNQRNTVSYDCELRLRATG